MRGCTKRTGTIGPSTTDRTRFVQLGSTDATRTQIASGVCIVHFQCQLFVVSLFVSTPMRRTVHVHTVAQPLSPDHVSIIAHCHFNTVTCSSIAGAILVTSGFFWFLVTGSVNALRFGIILGGGLLASAVGSLHAWQKGLSCLPYTLAQAGEAAGTHKCVLMHTVQCTACATVMLMSLCCTEEEGSTSVHRLIVYCV